MVLTPLKNINQHGNLPQIGVNRKKHIWNHQPVSVFYWLSLWQGFHSYEFQRPRWNPSGGNDEDLDTISKMWTYYAQTTQVMMGCLPTFTMKINQIMGKYTLHGWYGILSLWQYVYPQFTIVYRHILKLCLLATHVLPLFMAGQPTPP